MPAFRGRRHDAEWVAVTLSPFSLPDLLRKSSGERHKSRSGAERYPRPARLLVLLAGIVASWALLFYLASFVPF
ncbi:hypothetical protein [Erythrobacter sp. YT30]|uniref:hypothetical protein n=1 Tax=Erythrobacter sp. YT30 TaxID=1735012 RepID=UPI00076D684D|nr:hypothetical protein [Erythrobacter sp. YT30]KWV90941.1 hypothetical protein AUC45_06305 [Erythrobacter sp. YT30]